VPVKLTLPDVSTLTVPNPQPPGWLVPSGAPEITTPARPQFPEKLRPADAPPAFPAQQTPLHMGSELATSAGCDYRLVNTEETFEAFLDELRQQKRFAFDTETTSTDSMRATLVGISLAHRPGQAFYIPIAHQYLGVPKQLSLETVRAVRGPLMESDAVRKAAHNLKYDEVVLRRHGFGAKLCIHPKQVAAIHAALAPSPQDLDWARRVLAAEAASPGAARLDGRMIDRPVILQAQRTLQRAGY